MTKHLLSAAFALALQFSQAPVSTHAQSSPAPAQAEARTAFRFLLGKWNVMSHEDSTGRRPSQGETYSFDSIVAGGGFGGRWHFNRGTPGKPDFVDAVYYSGFDGRSGRWSFYYISPQSAQSWPGEFRDGRWYFRQTFEDQGTRVEQRQWWEAAGDTLVRRHIENSRDGGRSWSSYVITLRRAGESAVGSVAAQELEQRLVGTYTLEAVDNINPDGSRIALYGAMPQGILMFDATGHYSLQIMRRERPRFAANDRLKGSDAEVRAMAEGINTHFGRYTVDSTGAVLQTLIEHASFPNWEGQRRQIPFVLEGDRLVYQVAAPTTGGAGVKGEVVWRRLR